MLRGKKDSDYVRFDPDEDSEVEKEEDQVDPNNKEWINFSKKRVFQISPVKSVRLGEVSQNMTRRLNINESIKDLSKGSNTSIKRSKQDLLQKTVPFGDNPSHRVCERHEKSLSPSIVAKDKKGYQVLTPWDLHKNEYVQAKKY